MLSKPSRLLPMGPFRSALSPVHCRPLLPTLSGKQQSAHLSLWGSGKAPETTAVTPPPVSSPSHRSSRSRKSPSKIWPPKAVHDPSLPTLETPNGELRNVKVAKNTDLKTLVAALMPLLQFGPRPHVEGDPFTVGTPKWIFANGNDAIKRFLAVKDEAVQSKIIKEVQWAADEMNHHPHIASLPADETLGSSPSIGFLLTTHRPPGLSMRDVTLAQKIDQIVAGYATEVPIKGTHVLTVHSNMQDVRRALNRINRKAANPNRTEAVTSSAGRDKQDKSV